VAELDVGEGIHLGGCCRGDLGLLLSVDVSFGKWVCFCDAVRWMG